MLWSSSVNTLVMLVVSNNVIFVLMKVVFFQKILKKILVFRYKFAIYSVHFVRFLLTSISQTTLSYLSKFALAFCMVRITLFIIKTIFGHSVRPNFSDFLSSLSVFFISFPY